MALGTLSMGMFRWHVALQRQEASAHCLPCKGARWPSVFGADAWGWGAVTLREPVLRLWPHPVAAACQPGKLEIPAPGTLQESRGTCVSSREGPWQRQVCQCGEARP